MKEQVSWSPRRQESVGWDKTQSTEVVALDRRKGRSSWETGKAINKTSSGSGGRNKKENEIDCFEANRS